MADFTIDPTRIDFDRLKSELRAFGRIVRYAFDQDSTLTIEYAEPVDPAAIQSAIDSHDLTSDSSVENRDRLRNIFLKAKAVAAGEDTFTAAQIQRIVARLVLAEIQRRR